MISKTGDTPRRCPIALASSLVGLLLSLATSAIAQQENPTEADARASQSERLETLLGDRSSGNDESASVQERIDAISDETDGLLGRYRTTVKQIDSIRIYNAQMRDLIASQEEDISAVRQQLDQVEEVGRSVMPLMRKMIDALDSLVDLDVPFLQEERRERIDSLRALMMRADVTNAEKYRNIMEAYQVESEYGRTIEAYRASLEREGQQTTVDFLRFGRIALVYQTLDGSETGAWNSGTGDWMLLDDAYRAPIREGLRIARKQSPPDLIRLPLPAPVPEGP